MLILVCLVLLILSGAAIGWMLARRVQRLPVEVPAPEVFDARLDERADAAEAALAERTAERDDWQRRFDEQRQALIAADPTTVVSDGVLLRLCDPQGRLRHEVHMYHRTATVPKTYGYGGVTYGFDQERTLGVFDYLEEAPT